MQVVDSRVNKFKYKNIRNERENLYGHWTYSLRWGLGFWECLNVFALLSNHLSESHSVMSSSLRLYELYSLWNSPGQNTGVSSLSFLWGSSQPRSPALQADSLLAEPQGKPKDTGVGSLSLLQKISPTQELNQSLLQCRQILYQLTYHGSLSNHRHKKSRDLQGGFL